MNNLDRLSFAALIGLIGIDIAFDLPGMTGVIAAAILVARSRQCVSVRYTMAAIIVVGSAIGFFIHDPALNHALSRIAIMVIAAGVSIAGHPEETASEPSIDLTDLYKHESHDDDAITQLRDLASDHDSDTSDHHLSGFLEERTRVRHSVPMRVRLIDTGAFSDLDATIIADTFEQSEDEEDGAKKCVELGLLTPFQAECISHGHERQLRVGHYTLENEVGRGGMGVVYEALDRLRGDRVALKLFRDRSRHLHRIRREMRAVEELAHPSIVTALEVGDSDGQHFIAMELLTGSTLDAYVEDNGPLDRESALILALQIGNALSQAHDRGIIHRDVKPGNIMVVNDRNFKLMDLGLSRMEQDLNEFDSHASAESGFIGTIDFAAPEQAGAFDSNDQRIDIFGLGATLYFAMSGNSHLQGKSTREKLKYLVSGSQRTLAPIKNLSPSLNCVLERMLRYEPEKRYQSMSQATYALEDMDSGEHISTPSLNINVLIVEDSEFDLFLTKRLLERSNQTLVVSHAERMATAMNSINGHTEKNNDPLVVLLDLNLPDSDPNETIGRIGEMVSDQVVVVALTGSEDPKVINQCLSAGASEYVNKADVTSKRLERAIFSSLARNH